eukprot:857436-Amorphochlora_amoeboformis.AAC.1
MHRYTHSYPGKREFRSPGLGTDTWRGNKAPGLNSIFSPAYGISGGIARASSGKGVSANRPEYIHDVLDAEI